MIHMKHSQYLCNSEHMIIYTVSSTAYLQRIRAANHELVDKILQTEYDDYEPSTSHGNTTTCSLPEKRLAHLFHQQTLLLLLLQALPQSLEEVEEAMWNPEITDYIFRPESESEEGQGGRRREVMSLI